MNIFNNLNNIEEKNYYLPSFSTAILIYLFVIFFIFYAAGEEFIKAKKYTSEPAKMLEVSVIEIDKSPKKTVAKVQEPTPKIVEPKKEEEKPKEEESEKQNTAKKESADLKSLFSAIDTKKYTKEDVVNQKTKEATASRKKETATTPPKIENTAKKIIDSLEIKSSGMKSKSGEFDEYLGKISDILDLLWQETPNHIPGFSGKVALSLSQNAKVVVKITTLSKNNAFNKKLEQFLQKVSVQDFPPPPKDGNIEIEVEFKDEEMQ